MKRIVVVGETNVDVVLRAGAPPRMGREIVATDCALTLGSSSAICAMGLARLGNPVTFVSRAGADVWGDYCIGLLERAGIDTSHVVRDGSVKTGVTVSLTASGDRALVTYLGCIETVTESMVADALLGDACHLHVSSYFLQSALRPGCVRLFTRARAAGVSTSLDPGFDASQEWHGIDAAIECADVFLPNESELLALTGCTNVRDALHAVERIPARTVVKAGASGAMAIEKGRVLHAPAFQTDIVDTTGAGDSFNAGFLDAFLRRRPLLECLVAGNACGALSARALGGITAQPTRDEVSALVRSAVEQR